VSAALVSGSSVRSANSQRPQASSRHVSKESEVAARIWQSTFPIADRP